MYDCDCDDCKLQTHTLDLKKDSIKPLLNSVEKAFKQLHKNGKYTPDDLTKTKAYKNLITQTSQIFNGAIADNDIPEAMLKSLKEDTFIFSSLKTNAQLAEASQLLLTDDGKIKSFSAFSKDVASIKENYNQNYLEAEYQFALSSAQSAGNWSKISDDYDLQYRTAGDDRVRDSHDALRDTTLPTNDAFWLSYYPPNGWRCRCHAVQVRKGKYVVSNSEKSITKAENATSQIGKDGKNKLGIFRFNPGIQKVVFPPAHPYHKMAGAKVVKETFKDNEKEIVTMLPKNLSEYEKQLGVTINKDIFKHLKKVTPLLFNNPSGVAHTGAFYSPRDNYVKIPIDDRRKNSKWYSQAVVHHEFGHAIDFQTGLRNSSKIADLMGEARKMYTVKEFKEMYKKTFNLAVSSYGDKNKDSYEKYGAILDTIASLRPTVNMAQSHSDAYWNIKGNKEAEFIAHISENKFSGNDEFEKIMPTLYKKMQDFEFD